MSYKMVSKHLSMNDKGLLEQLFSLRIDWIAVDSEQ